MIRFSLILLIFFSIVGDRDASDESMLRTVKSIEAAIPNQARISSQESHSSSAGAQTIRGALLTTRIHSFEELNKIIQIEYFNPALDSIQNSYRKPLVRLTHYSNGKSVTSILKSGISEEDFINAKYGGLYEKISLAISTPYAVVNRRNLMKVSILARRRPDLFKEGDIAFFDLALIMVQQIDKDDFNPIEPKDLSEKGYLNTFNHITAQAFITSIFSERFADFLADAHERYHIPELITGKFPPELLTDIENGAVDNYVDIINNEWGQELGKVLKVKYQISHNTQWTPTLLANYLNDLQSYFSWALHIHFKPFRETDTSVCRFSNKINAVLEDVNRFSLL